ncbi:MAG: hypothetical protein AAGF72_04960 [Pseudomonadota bacterium]
MTTTSDEHIVQNKIILVHGHSLKPSEAALRDISVQALKSGVRRDYPDDVRWMDTVSYEFAYYGDLGNQRLLNGSDGYDESLDVGDRRNALQSLQAITARKKFGVRQYDMLPGKTATKEFVADVCAPLLGLLGLTLPLISWAVPDLAAYLRNTDGFGDAVRERVRDRIVKAIDDGDRLMLVTHGMGSVITFDVLWQLSRDPQFSAYADSKIDTFVTLGSPLCDDFLRRYLLGAKEQGMRRYPGNIISWLNLSAEDDYICHDGTIADDLSKMMRHRIVSQVRDFRIYNQAVRYGRSNPHSSVGYYIHPRLSKIIRDWLVRDNA